MKKYILPIVVILAVGAAATFYFVTAKPSLQKGVDAYFSENFEVALPIFRSLAEQGDAGGQAWLGSAYFSGSGAEKNDVEAERLFRLSALQGYPEGQKKLGYVYYEGGSFEKDNVLAYMWISVSLMNGAERNMLPLTTIENDMSPEEIETAKAMASACLSSVYENCDR